MLPSQGNLSLTLADGVPVFLAAFISAVRLEVIMGLGLGGVPIICVSAKIAQTVLPRLQLGVTATGL